MSEELWRPITGCEGCYEISSIGRVRSLSRKVLAANAYSYRTIRARILKQVCGSHGYPAVHLGSRNGKVLVHRLVLEAFVGPCPPGLLACHENGNREDCRLSNLRWDTPQSNMLDKRKHGTNLIGDEHWNTKLLDADVVRIRESALFGARGKDIAAVYGVSRGTVSQIINRQKRVGESHAQR